MRRTVPYSVIEVPAASWPPVLSDSITGESAPADAQQLLNMSVQEIGRTADGVTVFVSCWQRDPAKRAELLTLLGASVMAEGYGPKLWARVPARAKANVMRARVYRHVDPARSLRHEVIDTQDPERLRAGVPATGKTSRVPVNPAKALSALEQARARAQGETPEAHALTVAMTDVLDGDVVEVDMLAPVRIAGEPK